MSAQAVLTVAAVLFSLGLYCVITRRNAVSILMGVELMLNAANINLVAFSNLSLGGQGPKVEGHMFVVFVVLLAAAEAAVALAIILSIFRRMGTVEADRMTSLKE